MNIAFIVCGLPGIGYHGGAMTCWSIIQAMRGRGHAVCVVSLFDTSDRNPYRDFKQAQANALKEAGVEVRFIDHDSRLLRRRLEGNGLSRVIKGLSLFFSPTVEKFFYWACLSSEVARVLEDIKPDAIFCYHFDALSAVYNTKIAPFMAGVGDLWHLPMKFRWGLKRPSLKKYFVDGPYVFAVSRAAKKCMTKMLKPCIRKGAFAAHYAQWLKQEAGISDALYLRTPIHDPVGQRWSELRSQHSKKLKPRILLMGDLETTSTLAGLRSFLYEILPKLEDVFGEEGFEVRIVGGGNPEPDMARKLERPAIQLQGRVIPPDKEFLSADLLLVPTPISLGIRVRIITAFSFGTPVVTHSANTLGIPEIYHNQNALVADKVEEIAGYVIQLIKDEQLNRTIGENGRKTYEQFFLENVAANRIVDEIEHMVSGKYTLVLKNN
ncbi:MAG: glycosyltransferase family 4 protein [bacterium]